MVCLCIIPTKTNYFASVALIIRCVRLRSKLFPGTSVCRLFTKKDKQLLQLVSNNKTLLLMSKPLKVFCSHP